MGILLADQAAGAVVTFQDVALHGSESDCWSIVDGTVYDITAYIPSHPRKGGGSSVVVEMCGTDGTALYDTAHSTEHHYLTSFSTIKTIGTLSNDVPGPMITSEPTTTEPTTVKPTPTPTLPPTTKPTSPSTSPPTDKPTSPPTEPVNPTPDPSTVQPTSPAITSHYNVTSSNTPSNGTISAIVNATFEPTTSQDLTGSTTNVSSTPRPTTTTVSPIDDGGMLVEEASVQDEIASNSTTVSQEELMTHSVPGENCWAAYYGNVYDLSNYQHPDPIGNSVILCGEDSTEAFANVHDPSYLTMVEHLIVATLSPSPLSTLSPTDVGLGGGGESDWVEDSDTDNVTGFVPTDGLGNLFSVAQNTSSSCQDCVPLEELQAHATPDDCWVSYFGEVYNVTEFAPTHPVAGPEIIYQNCGDDGTAAYSVFHDKSLLSMIQQHFIGSLVIADEDSTTSAVSTTATGAVVSDTTPTNDAVSTLRAILPEEVATHNQPSDCWTIYYGNVYDLTFYSHPGEPPEYGQRVIYLSCGRDGTVEYASVHPKELLQTVNQFKVGWVHSGAASVLPKGSIAMSLLITACTFYYSG